MMEFFTTYQMPLIFGGLLIIMGLIGYEADQKMKGEGNPFNFKKEKKVSKDIGENAVSEEIPVVEEIVTDTESQNFAADEDIAEEIEMIEETASYQNEVPTEVVEYSAEESEEQSVDQLVAYDYQENIEEIEQIENYEVQNTESEETLQAFAEPVTNSQNVDTFGVNDMSSFQTQQNIEQGTMTDNLDTWKL